MSFFIHQDLQQPDSVDAAYEKELRENPFQTSPEFEEYVYKLVLALTGWYQFWGPHNLCNDINHINALPAMVRDWYDTDRNGIGDDRKRKAHAAYKIRLATELHKASKLGWEIGGDFTLSNPRVAYDSGKLRLLITSVDNSMKHYFSTNPMSSAAILLGFDVAWYWTQMVIAVTASMFAAFTLGKSKYAAKLTISGSPQGREWTPETDRPDEEVKLWTMFMQDFSNLAKSAIFPKNIWEDIEPTSLEYDWIMRLRRFCYFMAGGSVNWGLLSNGMRLRLESLAKMGSVLYASALANIHMEMASKVEGTKYGDTHARIRRPFKALVFQLKREKKWGRSKFEFATEDEELTQAPPQLPQEKRRRLAIENRPNPSQRVQGKASLNYFQAVLLETSKVYKFIFEYKEFLKLMPYPNCFYSALCCTCVEESNAFRCYCNSQDRARELLLQLRIPSLLGDLSQIVRGWKGIEGNQDCAVQVYYFSNAGGVSRGQWCHHDDWEVGQELRLIIVYGGVTRSEEAHCILLHIPRGENWFDLARAANFLLRFLPNIKTGDSPNRCPGCGYFLEEGEKMFSHFVRMHGIDNICPRCGFKFDTAEDLRDHLLNYCPVLTGGCKLRRIADEVEKFEEPKKKADFIVYADCESVIRENGMHESCMIGALALNGTGDKMLSFCYFFERKSEEEPSWVHVEEFIKWIVRLSSHRKGHIIVYFHNGTGYDFHFLIKAVCHIERVTAIDGVWETSQRVKFFSITYSGVTIQFKDSFDFMATSLSKWIEQNKKGGLPFTRFNECLKAFLPRFMTDEERNAIRDLILRKNPFPYRKLRSLSDLNAGKLWAHSITREEWGYDLTPEEAIQGGNHIMEVMDKAHLRTIRDYLKLYLMCDVTMLADCMENFCQRTQEQMKYSPHLFMGAPSLSWKLWLAQNQFGLEPIMDGKMYDLVRSTIRGGQVQASQRLYDLKAEPHTVVIDLDCNSLYPTAMINFDFPCCNWEQLRHPTLEQIKDMESRGKSGFALVDIELPATEETIKKYGSWPFMAESVSIEIPVVPDSALAKYQTGREHPSNRFSGLLQHLGKFNRYACSTKNLIYYVEHGAILTNIYYAYMGTTYPVFKDFVSTNLRRRVEFGSDPTLKALYKLLSNSLYGKTYEDIERRTTVKVHKANQQPDAPVNRDIDEENGWTFSEVEEDEVELNKPIYLGACVTEWSKLWMYRFFYDKVRKFFPEAEVLYTDTDAVTVRFPGVDSVEEVVNILNSGEEQLIDTSNFAVQDGFHNTDRNGEAGLFKSETTSRITKMVALRAKTYMMECEDGTVKMSMKGVPFSARKDITMADFERVLLEPGYIHSVTFDAISANDHVVRSEIKVKVALSADDLKREINDDLIHTKPRIL